MAMPPETGDQQHSAECRLVAQDLVYIELRKNGATADEAKAKVDDLGFVNAQLVAGRVRCSCDGVDLTDPRP